MNVNSIVVVKKILNLQNHAGILFLATSRARVRGTKEINETRKYYPDFSEAYESNKKFFVHKITERDSAQVRKPTQITRYVICGPCRQTEVSSIDNEIFTDTLCKLKSALKEITDVPGMAVGQISQDHIDFKYPQWKSIGKTINYAMEWALNPASPWQGRAIWLDVSLSVGEEKLKPLELVLDF